MTKKQKSSRAYLVLILALSIVLNIFSIIPAYAVDNIDKLYSDSSPISLWVSEPIETAIEKDVKETINHREVSKLIEKNAEFMQKTITNPSVGSVGGEWTILGLSRSSVNIPQSYYDNYYNNVQKYVKEKRGQLHHVKYTEYDRVIIALTSIGKDV